MAINEIEIPGSTKSFQIWSCKIDGSITAIFSEMAKEDEHFSIDPKRPGFHDLEQSDGMVRGFFSVVVPFEVEELVDGVTTKTVRKRIESCEFWMTEDSIFTSGKSTAARNMARSITPLAGFGVVCTEFDCIQMSRFHDQLSMVKKIKLVSPKDRNIRTATLTGRIEDYSSCGVVDPRNHGIDIVTGLIDTPLGPITATLTRKGQIRISARKVTATLTRKGQIRISARKGFLMTVECLMWIIKQAREENNVQPQ